ncbi:MAG: CPBP family intramembrane metalloprotease [Candidatus Dormibacteraeota bacterium]|nr:CPBP family intramembrane metalloprotease [Candidatus Dormibacteraeota bacterium]
MVRPRYSPLPAAIAFTIIAIAISWLCWLPLVAASHHVGYLPSSAGSVLILLGTFGPLLSAVALVSRTSGVRGLGAFIGQAFRWRAGIQWYAAALLVPVLVRIAVLYVHVLKGGTLFELSDMSRWLAIPSSFLLVLLIGGPTGEEFGWRGFLLQRIQPVLGVLWASIVIGLITTLWHLPLFWIPGTAQSYLPLALFTVRTVALSVISTLLYNGTRRSLLFVLLFHASLNTWPNSLLVLDAEWTVGPYFSSTAIYAGLAVQLVILGLLRGRGDRRKRADAAATVAA